MFEQIKAMFGSGKKKLEHKRILVVDDNTVDRTLIEKSLIKLGCVVYTAENGEQGLTVTLKEKPDLILSDCEMPKMSGIEMCKLIKEDELVNHIPIIMLTSVDTPSNIVDCFDYEVENFMAKPVNMSILTSQIYETLNEKSKNE